MQLIWAVLAVMLMVGPVFAQSSLSPPTDDQLSRQASAMNAEMARYYEMLSRRAITELNDYQKAAQQNLANPKATADWWAAYTAGLPPPRQ